ncbi:MAG: asparagine--tRNA ligase [Desulfobulbaceae bacterium]|nr:asparagine--tRNA ligase [Desulfobulbaceae bacterium]
MVPFYRIAALLAEKPTGMEIAVNGWVRTRRDAKGGFSFLEINDGSGLANLQVIADEALPNYHDEVLRITTGCAVRITGVAVPSPAKGQEIELKASRIAVEGWADPLVYPLQKKRHSYEFLRTIAHLRPRTNSLGAVTRIRGSLSFAVHQFFHQRGFIQVHTPIITTSDCEGAGEMFTATSLDLDRLPTTGGKTDFGQDFFGRRAGLTVSGQLEAEAYALAMGNVYTFGPTFRAENSNTSRHLAEFWMIEPEMAFCDLAGDIDLAEAFIKHLVRHVVENCAEDFALFGRFVDTTLPDRLHRILAGPFPRISYTVAVAELHKSGRDFAFPVQWGADLQSEHERYLCEEVFDGPLVVTDYPKTIKPFYMRANDDGKTVAAMDILLPGIGEIVGGSQREERLDLLGERMTAQGLDLDEYGWYLDLRRYGSAQHSGFGLGFERIIQFVTGMGNIRDVIPFPRTPGSASG